MHQTQALIMEREALPAGWERFTLHVPELAGSLRPGQLLAVQAGASPFEPLLKQSFPIIGLDAATSAAALLCGPEASRSLPHRPGDRVNVLGPVGRGWTVHPQTRNVVLLGPEPDVGALLWLASAASARSVNVALLVGASADRPVLPPALLPAAVEYQFARGPDAASAALELLDDSLLRWADAIYTTLPLAVYPALAQRIRNTRMHWTPGFAQGLIVPPMACFTGICDVCLVPEARRTWRACVDGPQCDLRDFVR
jgi:dihydroorotate dehydrogenase electron transfer subunit